MKQLLILSALVLSAGMFFSCGSSRTQEDSSSTQENKEALRDLGEDRHRYTKEEREHLFEKNKAGLVEMFDLSYNRRRSDFNCVYYGAVTKVITERETKVLNKHWSVTIIQGWMRIDEFSGTIESKDYRSSDNAFYTPKHVWFQLEGGRQERGVDVRIRQDGIDLEFTHPTQGEMKVELTDFYINKIEQ